MPMEIEDYDPSWPGQAAAACTELDQAVPDLLVHIEHVGSTSVPGLAAKPVIDLMAAVVDLAEVVAAEPALHRLGYLREETGMRQRLFYRRDTAGRRSHHLHIVTADSWDHRNERLLRDHLRAHPAARDRYAELKRELAGCAADPPAYTRGKTDLIQELTDRARAERGLPSVPVWED